MTRSALTTLFAFVLLLAAALPARAQGVRHELYGDFRYSFNRADAGDASYWAGANNASRLGVRGTVTQDGVTAFVDLQTGAVVESEGGAALTQRYFVAGLRGAFGTFAVGRMSTAYKMAGLALDPFYDSSSLSVAAGLPNAGLFAGASFGLSNLTNGWADRAIAYTSPERHGFTANAATHLDAEGDHDLAVGLTYRRGGWALGGQLLDGRGGTAWAQADGVDRALRGHTSYARGGWSVGVSLERVESRAGSHQNYLYLSGTTQVSARFALSGAVGHVGGPEAFPAARGMGYHVGAFVTPVPRVRVHAIVSRVDLDGGAGRGNVALGLTLPFSVGP